MGRRKPMFTVGEKNKVKKDMYKPLVDLCNGIRIELNQKARLKGHKKEVPFIYAQVELYRRVKKNANK